MPAKLIFFFHRQPALTREDFCARYLNEHAPLVLQHCSRVRRYVLNLVEDAQAKTPDAFDAAAELWFDSVDDYADLSRRYDTAAGRAAVDRSRAELVAHASGYLVDPTVQRDYERVWPDGERSPGVKTIVPLQRRHGLTREQFVEHWLRTHAPLSLEHVLGIGRYVTNVVVEPITPSAPPADGIVEVHYTSERRFSDGGQQIMMDDVAKFLSPPTRNNTGEHILKS